VTRLNACCEHQVPSAGYARHGDLWTCPTCDSRWVHDCDEAEGCAWYLSKRRGPDSPTRGAHYA